MTKKKDCDYQVIRQQLNHLAKEDYLILKELAHASKNLYNYGLYQVRQYFFEHKKYLCYEENYKFCKDNENYKLLNSNIAQQTLKNVDSAFKSFFSLLALAKQSKYDFKKVRLPKYLDKQGFYPVTIGFVRIDKATCSLTIPYSNLFKKTHKPITLSIPKKLEDKTIKSIKIVPIHQARFFEIQYTYEVQRQPKPQLDTNQALALDLGVNNLLTATTSRGKSFVIDGKRLKSINQWYNKQNSRLQSVKDKQGIKGYTKQQATLTRKRNNQVTDYMHKASNEVIDYCLKHRIGVIVLGYNEGFKHECNLGRKTNQQFVQIPYYKLKQYFEYKCKREGIKLVVQEESYTSKASFWDKDYIPTLEEVSNQQVVPVFSGQRTTRGVYRTKDGLTINSDVNGSLNILRKSNVVSLMGLYNRGAVDTPLRIRIA